MFVLQICLFCKYAVVSLVRTLTDAVAVALGMSTVRSHFVILIHYQHNIQNIKWVQNLVKGSLVYWQFECKTALTLQYFRSFCILVSLFCCLLSFFSRFHSDQMYERSQGSPKNANPFNYHQWCFREAFRNLFTESVRKGGEGGTPKTVDFFPLEKIL